MNTPAPCQPSICSSFALPVLHLFRCLLVLGGLLLGSAASGAADFANSYGLAGSTVFIQETVTDSSGNIYISGHFNGATLPIGSTTLNLIGTKDAFVAKLDSSGSTVWAKNFGGSGATVNGYGVAVDGSGNVVITANIFGADLTTPAVTRVGLQDALVIKLDSSGNIVWTKNFGGASAGMTPYALDLDSSGNVLFGGNFNGASLTTPALTKIGNNDAFAFKLASADGSTTWAKNFGGSGANTIALGIAADSSGDVLLAGNFFTANITTPALTRIGSQDGFVFKLASADGSTTWSKNFGGSSASTKFGGAGATATGNILAVDSSGNVLVTGSFNGANLTTPALTKIGGTDALAIKLDSSGNTTWAKNFGGVSPTSAYGNAVTTDSSGNVLLGGYFDTGNLTTPALSRIGNSDTYVIKLNSAGTTVWTKNFGGSGSSALGLGIAVDSSGNVVLGGRLQSSNMTTPAVTLIGSVDGLLIKQAAPPDAPSIGTATAGNTQASITFTAPTSNGGSAVTGYTATSSPGSISSSGCTSSPCTVTGLTNGVAYTFTVTATNATGASVASAASNSVTPVATTVPGAPTIGTATGGNAQASIPFTAPVSDGGSTITSYTATSSPGGLTSTGCTSSPCTVTGLTNGTAYTFTVTATNGVGTGSASSASNSVTPATTPGAPTIGTATGGNAQASIPFTAPVSDGGGTITAYTATSSPGSFTSTGCTSSPCTVTGLTNGTAYTFTVTATNSAGTGSASAASNSVTPATVPGAPTIGTATAGDARATVTFTAPVSNGGSAITAYTATSSPGGNTSTGCVSSPCTITGLTNGTTYTFSVTATNAAGTGSASAASNSVTPAAPFVPVIVPTPVFTVTVPSDTPQQQVNDLGTLFTSFPSGTRLSDNGVVVIPGATDNSLAPVTLKPEAAGNAVIQLPTGSTPVTFMVSNQTITLTPAPPAPPARGKPAPAAVPVQVQTKTVTVTDAQGNTKTVVALQVIQGTATLSGPSGEVLSAFSGTTGSGCNQSTSVIKSLTADTRINASAADPQWLLLGHIDSGAITISFNSCTTSGNRLAATTQEINVYRGEQAFVDKAAQVARIIVRSASGEVGDAGDPLMLPGIPGFGYGGTMVIPQLAKDTGRLPSGSTLQSRLAAVALAQFPTLQGGGWKVAAQDSLGIVRFSRADQEVILAPVGEVRVSPGAADGVAVTASAQGVITASETQMVVNAMPRDAARLVADVRAIDPQARFEVVDDGSLRLAFRGKLMGLQPNWNAGFSTDYLNRPSFEPDTVDERGACHYADGWRQCYYPVVNDYVTLVTLAQRFDPSATVVADRKGMVRVAINNARFELLPDWQLIPTPAERASQDYWTEGGRFFVRNPNGLTQGFAVR